MKRVLKAGLVAAPVLLVAAVARADWLTEMSGAFEDALTSGSWGLALGMVYVDRQKRVRQFQLPDLELLSVVGSQIATKLDAIVKERVQRNAAVSATEVSVVHSIQAQLDPKIVPDWDNLKLSAYGRSGQENAGDVYDIMQHPDHNTTALLLGHVNAAGAALALSIARLHSTFRVGFLHKDRPHALARALAWLTHDAQDPTTVDALFLMIDPVSARFDICRSSDVFVPSWNRMFSAGFSLGVTSIQPNRPVLTSRPALTRNGFLKSPPRASRALRNAP